ncbi:proline--tRNA ligase [Candidatus Wolfebacteria bacterium]|nr:proline--tRNA ligase [Candidatus Wolfebacteria bacterium]
MKTICKRNENYSQWYQDVIASADLAEHSVVRGCMIIKPYGYAIWERIVSVLDSMLKNKKIKNAYFPIFIPQSFLEKEKQHIEGFSPELAVVTHGGGKKLEEPLIIRPTSETIIYESFSKWIQSYRDLPFVINQWANVVRWEMRPRLFLRTTEFLWQEGHTAHTSLNEAEDYSLMILNEVYAKFAEEYLAMPVYKGQKSDGEKFAGALKTFCIEALMQDGKSLQAGTSHNLSDNFSKSFNVTFLDKDEKRKNVFQTSWGVSTRLIGGLIMIHSDDKGLVLPPKIAPIQVVIIPIIKTGEKKIISKAQSIAKQLTEFSVEVDLREDLRPGQKFYEWEKKGVPVRIEIGPKDLEKGVVILVRRDTGKKEECLINQLPKRVDKLLRDIQLNIFTIALKHREESNKIADSWKEFEELLKQGGYVFSYFCGEKKCEAEIKNKTKAVSRFLPLDIEEEEGDHYCIHCGKKTFYNKRWAFALSY